ncbi:helix-turn-helix transcriptional regulator [Rhodocytophaga rosea]|uniref:Helix-turn-helix transcriptional regulator n=1 Tax=Rhodocytophaga rosea TaxID=2704465 RepID=A0A6C0GKL3_9BACT|nr:AraC family transcriptional regulator [Rhodocytophaga rosea]QHT68576.1 helix-turn-helix transcriptional regulator [Rhodocytophaga rosea]
MSDLIYPHSKTELEHHLSETIIRNHTTRFDITHQRLGQCSLAIDKYQDFSLMLTKYQTMDLSIQVPLKREENTLVMGFLLKGTYHLSCTCQTTMKPGSRMFNLFPTFKTTMQIPSETAIEDLIFKVQPSMLHGMLTSSDDPMSDYLYKYTVKKGRLHPFRTTFVMDAELWQMVQAIKNCPYQGKMKQLYIDSQIKLMLLHQLAFTYKLHKSRLEPADPKLTKADIEKLHELRLFLETHFLEIHTLESLSRQYGLNLFKLKYGFKKLFNTSVIKWLDDKKLQYAYQALQQENAYVVEIAEALGYNHYNNFSAAFKRKFGFSPQQLSNKYMMAG